LVPWLLVILDQRTVCVDADSKVLLNAARCGWHFREHAGRSRLTRRASTINIYHASRAAMRDAVLQLAPTPDHLLIDALKIDCELPQNAIIHGDALSASIAAASILAKVERDRMMCEWDAVFPQYGLASHKGYSTPKHLAALRELGPTPMHRQSFAPVWQNPVPQEAFAFMSEDDAEVLAAEDLAG
jgi:ribonuclease HII